MALEQIQNVSQLTQSLTGGLAGGIVSGTIIALGIIFAFIIFAALYIYFAMAWMTIANKLKYKKWHAQKTKRPISEPV